MKKNIALILSVLMLVTLTAGLAFGAEEKASKMEMLTGQVVDVDAAAGKIVVMANDNEQTLTAEPKMLDGIDVGQKVTIEKSGDVVKLIRVQAEMNK